MDVVCVPGARLPSHWPPPPFCRSGPALGFLSGRLPLLCEAPPDSKKGSFRHFVCPLPSSVLSPLPHWLGVSQGPDSVPVEEEMAKRLSLS